MAGYIGNIPVPQGTQTRQNFTATASQTSFPTIGYTTGFIDVYLNGVKLINGTDFTATNGSDVVLTTAASASDVLDVVIFDTFTSSNGTFNDATLKNNATLKNDTHEDSDGGRASKIIYQGEQSGGEISTLAEIQASHDGTADDQKGDLIFKTNDGSDGTSPTERARIDSSGNFLVGKVASDYDGGVFEAGTGGTFVSRSGTPFGVNRNGSNGSLTNFYKDGGSVGNFGIESSGFVVDGEASHAGLKMFASAVGPRQNGSDADDTIDIGHSSGRFQDLYLSGGAYLGGTTSDNQLTDYEQGTFDVTLTTAGGSVTLNSVFNKMSYTKIGRQVTVFGLIITSAVSSPTGAYAHIDTLPFTSVNLTEGSGRSGGGVFWWDGSNAHVKPWEISEGATRLSIYIDATTITAGDDFYFSCTYQAA